MKSKQRGGVVFMLAIGLVALSMSSNAAAAPVLGGWVNSNGSEGKPAYYTEWGYWAQSWGATINVSAATRTWFMVPVIGSSGTMRVYASYGGANGQAACGQAVVLTQDATYYSSTPSICTVPYRTSMAFGDMYVPAFGSIMMIYTIPPQGKMTSQSIGAL